MGKYHFIAIGGIGMSGLAKYLLEDGHSVTGSDIQDSKYISALKDLGANVSIGHKEENFVLIVIHKKRKKYCKLYNISFNNFLFICP